ncbi:hypothetical protein QA942_18915 [Streptomyces sp. B21-106]|uniref:hypothetical protein n=1 Tax=unclassified Streptomyces TaxID=2593676 RepID=UPI002FF23915
MLFELTEAVRCAENKLKAPVALPLAHETGRGRGTLRGAPNKVWCARVEHCLNVTVIELAAMLIVAGLTARLLWRKVKQREDAAARGVVIKVPCLLRHPAFEGRWLRGRMVIGPTSMTWENRGRGGAAVLLPAGLRQVGVRSPSLRGAAWKMNGRSRIVECASSEGAVLVAVMPNELDHVLTALSRNGAA